MDFWEVVRQRQSVRRYEDKDVPEEMIRQLLEAAIAAPSAGNMQPWHFVVVRRPETRWALAQAAGNQRFVAQAPVVIVVCADPGRSASRYGHRGSSLYCLQDTAAAVEHILLGAVALGLGACWVGAFDEGWAAKVLDLPRHLRPVALIPLGYPIPPRGRTSRRPLGEVTHFIG